MNYGKRLIAYMAANKALNEGKNVIVVGPRGVVPMREWLDPKTVIEHEPTPTMIEHKP